MKLFIHDKFFDAFAKLPKTIQGRTRDLMKKFRDNSTSNAINYEKISTFKDPQLRTVRVNDTYRAIVHAPKTGDHYHLLWVDHHDKAMDWAKHKVFEWNRETQAYQVYELQEKASPTIKEEENREETVVSIYSDKQLLRIGVPEILLGSVKEINSFDDLEKWEKYLPQDVFENLFYLLDGLDINNLVRDVEEGKNKVVPETSINNQRHFYLVTDDEALEEVLSDAFVKWQIFLHPSQYAVAYGDFKGATKVTGGAGTGKTVAALHRAKHLSENELFPIEKPILFTTYTKALTSGLKKSFGALNIDSRKVKLQNIHAYAVEFAKEQGLIPLNAKILDFLDTDQRREIWQEVLDLNLSKFDVDFMMAEYHDVIQFNNVKTIEKYYRTPRTGRTVRIGRKDKQQIWSLVEQYRNQKKSEHKYSFDEIINLGVDYLNLYPGKSPFSYVIADEIQDFSNIELRLLRNLAPEGKNDLFLVGDPLQKIYNKQLNFSKSGINIRGRRSRRLKVNYRTTEEIRKLAMTTIQNIDFDDFDGEAESKKGYISLMHGQLPLYKLFDTSKEEKEYLLELVQQLVISKEISAKLDFREICLCARTNKTINDFKTVLHKASLPYYNLKDKTGEKSGIRLSTFHNIKGLEFKAIIMVGVQEGQVPLKPYQYNNWSKLEKKYHNKRERALLYVAMTRAIQGLYISGVGERSSLLSVEEDKAIQS